MMQRSPRSARLNITTLEGRTVPSTVTATTDARPLTFELRGNISNDLNTTDSNNVTTANHYDGVVTAVGTIDYTDATRGTSQPIRATGAGTGVVTVGSGGPTNYSNTFSGDFTVTDANGTWTTAQGFTGSVTQSGPDAASTGTSKVGPFSGSGTFDPSAYTFTANWDNAQGKGSFVASVEQPLAAKTDLAFATGASGEVTADGSVRVQFAVTVTGALMKAATENGLAAKVTAVWQGDPQSLGGAPRTADAGFSVPISWNAGTVTVDVKGLTMPAWARTLALKLDADNMVVEANEANNTLVISPTPLPVSGGTSGGGDSTSGGSTSGGSTSGGSTSGGSTSGGTTSGGTGSTSTPTPPPTVVGFGLTPDGTGRIQWRLSDGTTSGAVSPFGPGYTGRVNIGTGDLNNDGVLDVVASAGAGGGPRVVVIDGRTKQEAASFFAYEPSFTGGVSLAVADVTGDGRPDIVTGAGQGGGPLVNVFGATGQYAYGFFAYDPSFRNGVVVTAGDLDGNKVAEIITGTNPGGGPAVNIFNGSSGVQVDGFLAGPETSRGGVSVSVVTDATGKASVLSKVGPDPAPVLTGPPTSIPATPNFLSPFIARPGGFISNDTPLFPG